MIRNYNMEFQSKYGHADKLNLFYLDSKSERLLKEQNYIQTSRWLLMSISGIFNIYRNYEFRKIQEYRILCFGNGECKILERVGMTKKTRISNVCNRGSFLLVTVMWIAYEFWKFRDWYHAVVYENADFLFRFPLSGKKK